MVTEHQQELIDEIMDSFDFDTVSTMMLSVGFGWYASEYPNGSIYELKKFCRKHLKTICEGDFCISATGGFVWEKGVEDGQEWLKMSFVPEEIDTYN